MIDSCITKIIWEVVLTMENGKSFLWEGTADNRSHAEGIAIAIATEETSEQVYEVVNITHRSI